jgi:hypothetical protein
MPPVLFERGMEEQIFSNGGYSECNLGLADFE